MSSTLARAARRAAVAQQKLQDAPPTFRERIAALRYIPALAKLVWTTSPPLTLAMGVLRILRAFTPVATLWIGKLIVDAVVTERTHGADWPRLGRLVALELAVVAVGELFARASTLVESLLGDLFVNSISERIMEHATTLDLAQFEDPQFYDLLERARQQSSARVGLIAQLLTIAQNMLTMASLSAAILTFNPWLLLLLVLAILPSFIGETHFAALGYSLALSWTPQRRELDYLRYVGASERTAKEVQMFGLGPWFISRFRAVARRYYEENARLSVRRAGTGAALALLGTLGYYTAYVVILVRTVQGQLTIGTMTFLAGTFLQSRSIIQSVLQGARDTYEQALYLRDLFAFFEIEPTIRNGPHARPVPQPIREGFAFEDVGFQYPGSERWAIRHVNLVLRPGERLALVGENGAGKTTLTKLLARLYDPSEGRVLLDGVDLRDYDIQSVRQAVGVIFQDFVRYDMRFDENIGVGRIDEARPYLDAVPPEPVYPPIAAAADDSLAASLLPRFADGYRQMLGRRFENGVDLSGGEWQKVALARAYLRDAQLLILDEPTAALDARAEYEVFLRFSELTTGRMAVLISHRFSTVRMADRIIVLRHGQVVEDGTHDELLARRGLYSELFNLQAAGYR
jgi:ATP-binding cassette subfamily B protein